MNLHPVSRIFAAGLILLGFAVGAASAQAADSGEGSAQVSVTWTDPAEFTEVRYSHAFGQPKPESWLEEFRKTIVRRADGLLQPGQHLDVTFTDIKLAGQYEPWRGPAYNDVRIVKSIYAPRIDLRFSLVDADGKVLAGGARVLRDPAFLSRGSVNSSESYRFETRMLKDWLVREFNKENSQSGT